MSVKPLTPKEVGAAFIQSIPDFVVEAVNELLIHSMKNHKSATIMQAELEELIINKAIDLESSTGTDLKRKIRDKMFKEGWLDFEPIFRKHGWKVSYDRPAYNENYPASWNFTAVQ